MASRTCWRCLGHAPRHPAACPMLRSLPTTLSTNGAAAPFTTSASLAAMPGSGPPSRGEKKTFSRKKNKGHEIRSRPPEPGERKALRKRIVLSNTNALEVEGLQELTAESFAAPELQGQVVTLPGTVVDRLRAVEAFKVSQAWNLFRRPAMLVREETAWYGTQFEAEGTEVLRRIVVGERGSGKSMMLLQAMSMAFLKDWVVIHIPEAMDLVNGHTEYSPLPNTNPTLYAQKTYTAALLGRIARANPLLSRFKLTQKHTLPNAFQLGLPLDRLALAGAADPEHAWAVFHALTAELTMPGRPKLLITLDGLSHAMHATAYRSADFEPIHAHSLALLDWFAGHLGGSRALPNGGMVLAATSTSNHPHVPTLRTRLAQMEAAQLERAARPDSPAAPFLRATGQADDGIPVADPYARHDERVLAVLGPVGGLGPAGLTVQRLAGLSRAHARALMEYWARSGVMRRLVSDGLVGEKWTVSGGGVVGELERGCVRMRI